MAKSKSSRRWLKEHFDDPYVKQAQEQGYRSRSIYKLMEIDEKYRLFRPKMKVLELGAAPGGWSEYTISKIIPKKQLNTEFRGMLIAVDLLEMAPISGADIIQGDFTTDETLSQVMQALISGQKINENCSDSPQLADLVMSDMAPNISGMNTVDQPRAMYLAELAADLAYKVLKPGGFFLVKLFQGEGFDQFSKEVKSRFKQVRFIKPKASRPRSREVYMLAVDYNLD